MTERIIYRLVPEKKHAKRVNYDLYVWRNDANGDISIEIDLGPDNISTYTLTNDEWCDMVCVVNEQIPWRDK